MRKMYCGVLSRVKKISIILFFMIFGAAVFAQAAGGSATSGKFKQQLEWNADKNAFEYKVEVRQNAKIVKTFTTSDNYVDLNLPSGSYEYRVSVYDFLGRVQDVSAWQGFEISKASTPAFENVEDIAEVDISSGNKIVLPLEVENVAPGTTVTLVNTVTGAKIAGTLVMTGTAAGKSEIGKASAEFTKIPAGEWKLVVENPSGLKAESPVITIKTINKKKLAEQEARAAAELAEREAAELAERERQEQLERERLEQEAREAELLAQQKALEEAEALKEQEEPDEPEEPEEPKPSRPAFGVEVKLGPALALSLFSDDILSRKNYDWMFGSNSLEKMTITPYAAISVVPNFGWFINPGLEISAHSFITEYHSPAFDGAESEYKQKFIITNAQLNVVGQMRIHPQKFFVNVKAGGGVTDILMKSEYNANRENTEHNYLYPKFNAGLSMEVIPLKHLVFEAGADYNMIISNKVKVSYLLPYVVVGVRF